VELRANGAVRAEVRVGEPVTFTASVETPPGAGPVVAADWDFAGEGAFAASERIAAPHPRVRLEATHAYSRPGTYYPVLRATVQREGDAETPYARVQNIGRARVVVS
jgi:hypothetical protein